MQHRPRRLGLVAYALRSGGVGSFLLRVGRHMAARGWAVEIVTTEEPGDWNALPTSYGIGCRHIEGIAERTRIDHAVAVGRDLASSGYDAILLNHAEHAQISIGMLPDSTFVAPILHGDDDPVYAVACANRHAWNVIVAPSPRLYTRAVHRVPDRPVAQIAHGVPIPREEHLRIEERMDEPLRLAFVGRLDDSHKGISLLPPILQGLARRGIEARLTIIGRGPDEERLRAMLREADLQERAVLRGAVPPLDVYRTLLESHMLLFPSTREGFGIALLEAQACGCVPIASHLPEVTDAVVADRHTGRLVPPGDADRLAAAAAEIAEDRALWARMSRAAHEAAAEGFSLDRMGEAYERLLADGCTGRYRLRHARHWRRPFDLESIRGEGFIPQGIRRFGRWLRARRSRR